MTLATTDNPQRSGRWQIVIAFLGVLGIVAAVALELVILRYHSTSTVTRTATVITSTRGPSAPAAALVTTCLATGVTLLLVAAFFSRISKVAIAGIGQIDLSTAASLAGKVAAKAKGDPVRAEQLYKSAASKAAGLVSQRLPVMSRMASLAPTGWSPASSIDDAKLQELVDEADKATPMATSGTTNAPVGAAGS